MRTVNVALIGYKFMGRAHSNGFRQAAAFFDVPYRPVLKVLCGRDRAAVQQVADRFGWEEVATDWQEVVNRRDIDIVDIATPGDSHRDIAVAAAKAGKHVICEKPLANTLAEAKEMWAAVKQAGVINLCNFNYRRVPAVRLAKRLISEGVLGTIRHYRGTYLQDWIVDPNFPLVWRLVKESAGSGALGDIGAHSIDLARYLVGEVTELTALTQTFIKERPLPTATTGLTATAGREMGKVTVDDAALILARFEGEAIGTFEATRFALGRLNYNRFEINGSRGSVAFNFERMNELDFFSGDDPKDRQGWRVIQATEGVHDFVSAWWPPGHGLGYEHTFTHAVVDFLRGMAEGKSPDPDFREGAQVNAVLDATLRSAESGQWVKVERIS